MPLWLLPVLAKGKGLLRTIAEIWRSLPWPVQLLIIIGLAFGVGFWRGEARGDRRCQAKIDASIKAARDFDTDQAAKRAATAEQQRNEAQERARAVDEEVRRYAEDLTKQTVEACRAGALAASANDGLGVQDDPVQQSRPRATGRRGYRSEPGSVQKGKRE